MSTYAKDKPDDLLATFKGWFKHVLDVEDKQRKREQAALRAQVDTWDPQVRNQRMGNEGGQGVPATPGQPTMHISLLKQPMQLVKNQAQAADLGIEIHAVSEKATTDIAETMQDHYRAIERDSNAEQVRLWGFDRGVQCGRGGWRVDMVYDDDSDYETDQKIVIRRVLDWDRVGFDPSAQELDLSDANYAFAWGWVPYEQFREEYPDDDLSGYDERQFAELVSEEPEWAQGEGDNRAIMVAEVWRKKREKKSGRIRDRVTLCWYKITATKILDQEEWPAEYDRAGNKVRPGLELIPLVPYLATELQPFDKERRFEGMVEPAMDGQRGFDYAISSAIADVGRLSKIPYIGPSGSIAGHEAKWNSANVRNWSFIEYNVVGPDGQAIPPPTPMQVDGTKLGLSLQLAELCKSLVQSATAVYDPSLGETPKKGQSGRAVIAQQQQSDAGTSNYLQTLANISMRYEARVTLERMVYGYDRPGRIISVRGPEDELKQVMLNAPYRPDANGRPQRVPEGTEGAKFIDYSSGGKYGVAISVGKSYQTRLQAGKEIMGEMIPTLPEPLQILLLPTWMKFLDSPGASTAADLMAKYRDAQFPGLVKKDGDQPDAKQLQAQLQGQQQKMQEMQQQLQLAIEQIKTDQAKQQAQMMKAQLDAQTAQMQAQTAAQTTLQKAQMDNAARIEVARIGAAKESANQEAEAQEELLATGLQIQADHVEKSLDRAHEQDMTEKQRVHDVAMGAATGNTAEFSREGGQETGEEQSQETSEGRESESTQGARKEPEPKGENE